MSVLCVKGFCFSSSMLKHITEKLQCRNTFILKRRIPVPLAKKGKQPKIEEDHSIYDLIEDANVKRKPDMQLVLTEFVEDIGTRGQVVHVRPIFGYNFLLLPGRALYPTPENIAQQKLLSEGDEEKHSTISAYKTMKTLCNTLMPVYMHMKNQWTIQPQHVRIAFRKQGVHILDDECIRLPEKPISGPNLELEGKDFVVTVTINNLEKAIVRCRLQHWAEKYSDRITLAALSENIGKPLFSEQEELLKSIPLPVRDNAVTRK